MRLLTLILCLFVFSCDDDDNPVAPIIDECGVVNGDNSTCTDECGVVNGDNSTCLDECEVINGDNSTCLDECEVINGPGLNADGCCDGEVNLWDVCYNIDETTFLSLNNRGFSGEIPAEIGQLSNLGTLSLGGNHLSGIPQEFENLTSLINLILGDNQFFGEIPSVLFNLTNLSWLDLSNNQLTTIPQEIGQLSNLYRLTLYGNQFSEVPEEIGQLSNLNTLHLSFENILPPEFWQLTNLEHLQLYGLGQIPPEIGQLTNLKSLYMHRGNLSGNIPPSIGQLTNLTTLHFWDNQLSGEIPSEIGNLTNLLSLRLDDNLLTGNIPQSVKNVIVNINNSRYGYSSLIENYLNETDWINENACGECDCDYLIGNWIMETIDLCGQGVETAEQGEYFNFYYDSNGWSKFYQQTSTYIIDETDYYTCYGDNINICSVHPCNEPIMNYYITNENSLTITIDDGLCLTTLTFTKE